jgi:hypothetical protein
MKWKATPVHQGVVQDRSGTGRGTTWTVKWEGYPKSAVHVGKDLSMSRIDPPAPLPAPPALEPEPESAQPPPKGGTSKASDAVPATWDDSEDDVDSEDDSEDEGGGGGHKLRQPRIPNW